MGLDMYLEKHRRAGGKPADSFIEDVGYWRKANAIHGWFVEHVQDGKDDCNYHRPVTQEDLRNLLDLCKRVMADHRKASKLLPATRGFFFGGYDYDECYFHQITETAALCQRLLSDFDFENYALYYLSSW